MKKIIMLVASAVFALGLSLAHAADAPKGPVKVMNFGKKEVVSFDHAKHKDVKCAECHHGDAGRDGKFKCGECHGEKDDAKTKAPNFKDAAHKKDAGQCYKCHFGDGAKHKLACGGCHKK
jgi:hypothetical protein